MSTGKRLAKRSILGTRVCAMGPDNKFSSGVIVAMKTTEDGVTENKYSIRFDGIGKQVLEFRDVDIVGPGFQAITSVKLKHGQKVYVTHGGRETPGTVLHHRPQIDEVLINICQHTTEAPVEVKKKLEEVRLLESRKSARLMDQDTDFAKLADVATDRRRPASYGIDVPTPHGSRKRRPSSSTEDSSPGIREESMNECTAAMVLMSLSCSPHSPRINMEGVPWTDQLSPGSSSGASSWRSVMSAGGRSGTPSPPLSESAPASFYFPTTTVDEGIGLEDDLDELPKKKRNSTRTVFQCTWPGCSVVTSTCAAIERHVRATHLGPKECEDSDLSDHEEEFYYTEMEVTVDTVTDSLAGLYASSPPTLSHMDMARPPHEDPEYQKQLAGQNQFTNTQLTATPTTRLWFQQQPLSPQKCMRLSPRPANHSPRSSPIHRRPRGDTKKCRKVYGMEHRDQWCTQCKWKKACTRFSD